MSNDLGSAIRDEILRFLEPLASAASVDGGTAALVKAVGHVGALGGDPQLVAEVERLGGLAEDIGELDEEDLSSWQGIVQVLQVARDLVAAVRSVESTVSDPNLSQRAQDLGVELAEQLLSLYLRAYHPRLFRAAVALTLITPAELAAPEPMQVENGDLQRLPWFRDRFHFERVSPLLKDPLQVLADGYLPNDMETAADAHEAAARLFPLLRDLCAVFEIGVLDDMLRVKAEPPFPEPEGDEEEPPDPEFEDNDDSDVPFDTGPQDISEYQIAYCPRMGISLPAEDAGVPVPSRLGLVLTLSSAEHPDGVRGYVLSPVGDIAWSEDRDGWRLELAAAGAIPAFVLGPNGVELAPLQSPLAGASAVFSIDRDPAPGEPAYRLGAADGTRIEVGALRSEVELVLSAARQAVSVAAHARSGALVLAAGEGDGLLGSVLPAEGARVTFDLGLVLSSDHGLAFKGGAGLEAIQWPNRSIGPLTVTDLRLALEPASDEVRFVAAGGLTVRLGPVMLGIEGLGLALTASASSEGGNLGPFDLDAGFRPPTGGSIAIDTSFVKGGGSLIHEPERHRYAGSLVLEIGNVTVSAVGLLSTRLPDGREGYSLLISIAASGFTPIQLGLAFTLNGVGGLLGVHRSASLEVLRSGLRNGTLDRILFPTDPAAQLPRLITTLEQAFPSTAGRHLMGPAAIIGWGSPTLVTLELAIILELPSPVRLIVLGQVRALLPDEEAAIVRLNMDAVGAVDFGEEEMTLDATLYRSRLMRFALSGDMAMRGRWESEPGFILAVGGVNPRFNAPAALALPRLSRVAIDFSRGDNPRLRLSSYLAISSNTVQLGALAELYMGIAGLSLEGFLGFDLLIQISPFGFIADLSGVVTVKWRGRTLLGVYLDASLSGPNPLVVSGKAKVKVWIFSKTVDFDRTLGDEPVPPPLPPADPLPDLVAALADERNWSAQLPEGQHMLVALREVPARAGVVLAHPLGTLQISQGVVPLNLDLERYRGAPAGGRRFSIDPVAPAEAEAPEHEPLQDWFAPSQFFDLTDTQRLSRPSFERLDAGLRFRSGDLDWGGSQSGEEDLMAVAPIAYETETIDRDGELVGSEGGHVPDTEKLTTAIALRAVARKGAGHSRRRYGVRAGGVRVTEPGYAVVDTEELRPAGDAVSSFSSASQDNLVRSAPPPGAGQTFQVVGSHLLEETGK